MLLNDGEKHRPGDREGRADFYLVCWLDINFKWTVNNTFRRVALRPWISTFPVPGSQFGTYCSSSTPLRTWKYITINTRPVGQFIIQFVMKVSGLVSQFPLVGFSWATSNLLSLSWRFPDKIVISFCVLHTSLISKFLNTVKGKGVP